VDRGPWLQTATGGYWYPFAPRAEDVRLDDMIALARVCRYGGHLHEDIVHYSVAEHAVRCFWAVRSMGGTVLEQLAALHHDSHEAYPPGDQLGPFLRAVRSGVHNPLLGVSEEAFRGLLEVEARAEAAVREAFDLGDVWKNPTSATLIKRADHVLLATERRDLLAEQGVEWGPLPAPLPRRITPWRTEVAWDAFYDAHQELWAALGRLERRA